MKRKYPRTTPTAASPSPKPMSVKLCGGPLDRAVVSAPRGVEVIHFGRGPRPFFTYTYAGKDGRQVLFAKAPKSRAAGRFIFWYVGKHGRDPRVEAAIYKQQPIRNPGRVAHGRGAARRAARRATVHAQEPVQA